MQVFATHAAGNSAKLYSLRNALRDLLTEDLTEAVEEDLSTFKWTYDALADHIGVPEEESTWALYPVGSRAPHIEQMDMAILLEFPFWREYTRLLIIKIVKLDRGDLWI